MTERRVLLVVRLLLGALLIRQGAIGLSDLQHLAQTMEAHSAWQSWPLVGSLRPMGLALWIAAGEFTVGVFLIGGLLTRVMALASALLAAFALATLGDLGPAPNVAHAALLVASLVVLTRGGGAGTMDSEVGRMQRRSLEREAEREAARRAALSEPRRS
jgi:uncharacterized membrane protein YphA (DoxX/SURF4 family)